MNKRGIRQIISTVLIVVIFTCGLMTPIKVQANYFGQDRTEEFFSDEDTIERIEKMLYKDEGIVLSKMQYDTNISTRNEKGEDKKEKRSGSRGQII